LKAINGAFYREISAARKENKEKRKSEKFEKHAV